MNEVIKAMKERRSIRKFKSDMIPCMEMDQIIDAGLYARKVKAAEAIVYSTPLYYHAASAQLLSVINRFHGIDHKIKDTEKNVFF